MIFSVYKLNLVFRNEFQNLQGPCNISVYLQSPSEFVPTYALSGCFITGSSSPTLAPLQTALPEGACWAGVLAVAPYEPWKTLTCPLGGIAESSVLTLALLTAAWAPVFVITG